MIKDIAQLSEFDSESELSSLQPMPDSDVRRIAADHPGISEQYLEFIRSIGTGEMTRGFCIYEPEPASLVEQHPSFQMYQSSYSRVRSLFGQQVEPTLIPADAVMIADSGASWRYCLCPSLSEGVFCLDMGGPTFEIEAENFFSFVASILIVDDSRYEAAIALL
jgi:hypothetical protein